MDKITHILESSLENVRKADRQVPKYRIWCTRTGGQLGSAANWLIDADGNPETFLSDEDARVRADHLNEKFGTFSHANFDYQVRKYWGD